MEEEFRQFRRKLLVWARLATGKHREELLLTDRIREFAGASAPQRLRWNSEFGLRLERLHRSIHHCGIKAK